MRVTLTKEDVNSLATCLDTEIAAVDNMIVTCPDPKDPDYAETLAKLAALKVRLLKLKEKLIKVLS